jgi:hypothetical protein
VEVREFFFRQKFPNCKRSERWHVVVVKHPVVCIVRSDSLDLFSKSFQDIFVEGVINCLSWTYKLFVHNATAVEKKQSWFSPSQVDGWLWGFAEEMAAGTQSEIWLATEVHAVLSGNYLTGNFVMIFKRHRKWFIF